MSPKNPDTQNLAILLRALRLPSFVELHEEVSRRAEKSQCNDRPHFAGSWIRLRNKNPVAQSHIRKEPVGEYDETCRS